MFRDARQLPDGLAHDTKSGHALTSPEMRQDMMIRHSPPACRRADLKETWEDKAELLFPWNTYPLPLRIGHHLMGIFPLVRGDQADF
jgi:hypothetical protein